MDDNKKYKAPQPEVPFEDSLEVASEPRIEFYGSCKICELPLNKADKEFCEECNEDMIGTLTDVWNRAKKRYKN